MTCSKVPGFFGYLEFLFLMKLSIQFQVSSSKEQEFRCQTVFDWLRVDIRHGAGLKDYIVLSNTKVPFKFLLFILYMNKLMMGINFTVEMWKGFIISGHNVSRA
mgnify:CR=1 FL=1